MHEGEIMSFDTINNLNHIMFQQGDGAEFAYNEIHKHKTIQYFSKQKQPKLTAYEPKRHFNNSVFFIQKI